MSVFGSGSVFGQQQQQQQQQQSVFGAPSSLGASSVFGQPSGGSVFGGGAGTSGSVFGGGSVFGAAAQPSVFGGSGGVQSGAGSVFGAPSSAGSVFAGGASGGRSVFGGAAAQPASGGSVFGASAPAAASADVAVVQPPTDGIASLSFSPKENLLVAGSWDNKVRCWQISGRETAARAMLDCEGPVLCTAWSADGSRVFVGGADNKAKMWSPATGQSSQIAQHDSAVRAILPVNENVCVTGSWDKTLKFWDVRTPSCVHTTNLPDKVYCMDARGQALVVATANRHIVVYELSNPQQPLKTMFSPLKFQNRSIALFPDASGFALGSIEGRCAIEYFREQDASRSFAFKCHRPKLPDGREEIHAVNAVSFHPTLGTFATAGADGSFTFWDKDNRTRLKAFPACGQPLSATTFNADGSIFAYAASYDWSKGLDGYREGDRQAIMLHYVQPEEVRPKPGTQKPS